MENLNSLVIMLKCHAAPLFLGPLAKMSARKRLLAHREQEVLLGRAFLPGSLERERPWHFVLSCFNNAPTNASYIPTGEEFKIRERNGTYLVKIALSFPNLHKTS